MLQRTKSLRLCHNTRIHTRQLFNQSYLLLLLLLLLFIGYCMLIWQAPIDLLSLQGIVTKNPQNRLEFKSVNGNAQLMFKYDTHGQHSV